MKKNWKTWLCSILVIGATLSIGLFAGCTADELKSNIDQALCQHNYGAMVTKVVKEATCTDEGEELWTCIECGKEKTVVLEKIAHDYTAQGGWTKQTKAPTCREEGENQSRCGICKTVVTESIEKKPHSVKEMDGQAPTCTVAGYTEYSYCSVCNDFITPKVTIPALGHAVKVIKGQEATCTSSGLTDGKVCERNGCGKVLTEQKEIPALGHKIEYLEPIEATCEETGLTAGYACSRCDTVYVEQTETPLKDHIDNDGDFFCDVCFDIAFEELVYWDEEDELYNDFELGSYLIYIPTDKQLERVCLLLNGSDSVYVSFDNTGYDFNENDLDNSEDLFSIILTGNYLYVVCEEGFYVDSYTDVEWEFESIGFELDIDEGYKLYKVA